MSPCLLPPKVQRIVPTSLVVSRSDEGDKAGPPDILGHGLLGFSVSLPRSFKPFSSCLLDCLLCFCISGPPGRDPSPLWPWPLQESAGSPKQCLATRCRWLSTPALRHGHGFTNSAKRFVRCFKFCNSGICYNLYPTRRSGSKPIPSQAASREHRPEAAGSHGEAHPLPPAPYHTYPGLVGT